jgi:hypothetical protein
MKILILDDVDAFAKRFKGDIEKGASGAKVRIDAQVASPGDFVPHLREAQKACREGKARPASKLDEFDLIFVDYDLGDTKNALGLTGEEFSYLARAFSTCGAVVALNQFPKGVFDLTLTSRYNTWADSNVDDAQLSNPGLWNYHTSTFRPWAWPALSTLPDQMRWLTQRVEKALKDKENIGSLLGLGTEAPVGFLPVHLDFFGGLADSVETFARNQLNTKDRDGAVDRTVLARCAASRLRNFIEGLIVPSQDLLTDLPHLMLRYPSVIKIDEDLDRWNKAFLEMLHSGGPKQFRAALFALSPGMSRTLWWLSAARENKDVPENKEPWTYKVPPFVFFEDCTGFGESAKGRRFAPGALGSNQGAYVAKSGPGISYLPASRWLD